MPAERFRRVDAAGNSEEIVRQLADETPIAIEINGIGYAVLMASAADLDDLAVGFVHAERLIDRAETVLAIDPHPTDKGVVLRVTLAASAAARVHDRVRHRTSESSCGICGIENLDQALRPLPRVTAQTQADEAAIFRALAALDDAQPLNRTTGAVHAAALCDSHGSIRLVREDVGRHNAVDKLIGAMLAKKLRWDGGFLLVTSRCSFELVEKAALADCPMLVAISAPTALAVERAREARLRLAVLARRDAILMVSE